jgi:hypothetical protein
MLDQRDTASTFDREEGEARLKLANRRDANLISGTARRDSSEICVTLSQHQPTCAALPARAATLRS